MTEEQSSAAAEESKAGGGLTVTFGSFVHSLAMSALVHLGEIPDPSVGGLSPNLPLARQTIDLLHVLSEKTKGNLEEDEDKLLSTLLNDLRLKYVQANGGSASS